MRNKVRQTVHILLLHRVSGARIIKKNNKTCLNWCSKYLVIYNRLRHGYFSEIQPPGLRCQSDCNLSVEALVWLIGGMSVVVPVPVIRRTTVNYLYRWLQIIPTNCWGIRQYDTGHFVFVIKPCSNKTVCHDLLLHEKQWMSDIHHIYFNISLIYVSLILGNTIKTSITDLLCQAQSVCRIVSFIGEKRVYFIWLCKSLRDNK